MGILLSRENMLRTGIRAQCGDTETGVSMSHSVTGILECLGQYLGYLVNAVSVDTHSSSIGL